MAKLHFAENRQIGYNFKQNGFFPKEGVGLVHRSPLVLSIPFNLLIGSSHLYLLCGLILADEGKYASIFYLARDGIRIMTRVSC